MVRVQADNNPGGRSSCPPPATSLSPAHDTGAERGSGMPVTADDSHRAGSVVHAVLTPRAEQRSGETAVAATADHEQIGADCGVQQRLSRVTLHDERPDADATVRVDDTADLIGQRLRGDLREVPLLDHCGGRPSVAADRGRKLPPHEPAPPAAGQPRLPPRTPPPRSWRRAPIRSRRSRTETPTP